MSSANVLGTAIALFTLIAPLLIVYRYSLPAVDRTARVGQEAIAVQKP
jgi:hypothetical protein